MKAFALLVMILLLSADSAVSSELIEKLAVRDFKTPEQLVEFVNNNNIAIVRIESFANRRFKFQRLWYEQLKLKGDNSNGPVYATGSNFREENYEE